LVGATEISLVRVWNWAWPVGLRVRLGAVRSERLANCWSDLGRDRTGGVLSIDRVCLGLEGGAGPEISYWSDPDRLKYQIFMACFCEN
jgi:hypothetical protein